MKYGGFSEYILAHWQGERLFSVDPWRSFDADEYRDVANVEQQEFDRIYDSACNRLARFGQRSVIMRTLSVEAAARFRESQLDFVYLDARHDYAGVKEDLEAWLPKVRSGGILAGHDYLDGMDHGTEFGVKRAVDEFAREHGYVVRVSMREPVYKSWFLFV